MNRDFILPATPGAARKLLKVASLINADVDPAIMDLAMTGRVTQADFPTFNEVELAAAQSILDYRLRCLIPSYRNIQRIVLKAFAHAGVNELLIVTNKPDNWSAALKSVGIDDVVFFTEEEDLKKYRIIRERRGGGLIVDLQVRDERFYRFRQMGSFLAQDFAQAVCIMPRFSGRDSEIAETVKMLFPNARTNVLDNEYEVRKDMEKSGFKRSAPSALYALFNIVEELFSFDRSDEPMPAEQEPCELSIVFD